VFQRPSQSSRGLIEPPEEPDKRGYASDTCSKAICMCTEACCRQTDRGNMLQNDFSGIKNERRLCKTSVFTVLLPH